MLNIKDTINFTTLRERGPSSLEVSNEEIIQIVARNSDIKIVLTQEYFMKMYNCYMATMNKHNSTKEKEINVEEKIKELEKRFINIANEVNR